MADRSIWLVAVFIGAALAGCSGAPSSGPVEVKWDRDQCERCRMVLSDRHHAAKVRQSMADGHSKVYRFDDFGCAVIWLAGQAWRDAAGVEFWVTDHRTGEWTDARTAFYIPGQMTPMGYGLGAQREPADNGLTFEQAGHRVREAERRFGRHGGHDEAGTAAPPADAVR